MENKDCNIKADIRKPKKVLNVSTSSELSQARFTRRRQHTELIAKRINYQKACDSVGCLLFLVNDQAGFAIFDAMDRLKRSPLYKQKVKQLANKASKAYDLYEKTRRSMFLNKDVEEAELHPAGQVPGLVAEARQYAPLRSIQRAYPATGA